MKQKKIISHFWLYNLLPYKIVKFFELIRFEKPIGFLLLMWPCWFALAQLSIINFKWYLLFFLGSFFMRGVGCIINDYFDRFIDQKVKRTSKRPIASGTISIERSFLLMLIFLIISFIILLNFNYKSIILAILSLPLIVLYPLMKRFTYWPQIFLGLIFNWGILIVSMQFKEVISLEAILLYIGCIFWTLGYDTIYAYQDRGDDIKIKLKSTAILFRNKGKLFVMVFYSLFIFSLLILSNLDKFNPNKSLILIVLLSGLLIYLNKWKINDNSSSNKYFKNNNLLGLTVFLFLII